MSAFRPTLALLALGSLLGACSTTGVTPPASSGPTSAQTIDVGATMQDEVEADASSLNATTAIVPSFLAAAGPVNGISAVLAGVGSCVAPSSTTDTDGDGIYDDATFTYTNPPCSYTNRRGGTVALTGALRIQDPTAAANFAYNSTLTNLTYAYTNPTAAKSYTVARAGTRNVSVTGAGVNLASNLTIQRTFAAGTTAAITKQWTESFTPATGSTLVRGQPLPSGTLSISGSYGWTRGTEAFAITVTTPTPLVYDATCTQAQAFTSGQLRAQGTYNGVAGYLRVTWTGCGVEPSVIFVAI